MTIPTNSMPPSTSEAPTTPPPDPGHSALTVSGSPVAPAAAPMFPVELADHPRYRILHLLGQGGMGAVYKAEDQRMGRVVALKVVQPTLTADSAAVQRFEHEVRAAAQLAHPNIVTAYDADQAGSLRFLVMEYVEGQNLADYLRDRGRLSVTEACDCVRQAALGLHHAQERGMVHRDIKPHNLMRTRDGTIKILDFGLARLVRAQQQGISQLTQLTQQGVMMGTVDYMAPEQASDSRAADIRSDIYSLGCTLYQLLTGRVPFPEGGPIDKVIKHAVERPTPINELRPEVPAALARTVQRMMSKEPAARFQTPAEVASVLALFSDSEPEELPSVLPASQAAVYAAPTITAPLPAAVPAAPKLSHEERESILRRLRGSVSWLRFASFLYRIVTFVLACVLLFMLGLSLVPSSGVGSTASVGQLFLLGLATCASMVVTVVLSFGASQMRLGQGYNWALAAAIVALLPITPLILITGPIGLLALERLSQPDVKAAFGKTQH